MGLLVNQQDLAAELLKRSQHLSNELRRPEVDAASQTDADTELEDARSAVLLANKALHAETAQREDAEEMVIELHGKLDGVLEQSQGELARLQGLMEKEMELQLKEHVVFPATDVSSRNSCSFLISAGSIGVQLVICDTGIRIISGGATIVSMQYNQLAGWEADEQLIHIITVDGVLMAYETQQGSEICEALMQRATKLISALHENVNFVHA